MTSSAKSFFLLLLVIFALAAGVIYLLMYQEHIAMILGGCLMVLVCFFIFYVNLPPLFNYLSERASNIMAIYPDISGKGLHIFSSFTTSRIKVGLSPLRTIQYYFLLTDSHKIYYTVMLTHDMESARGHSGYTDFSSFEEDVLDGEKFKETIEKYSAKAGWPLQLGKAVRAGEDENYETKLDDLTFRVETKKGMIQDTLRVCCYDANGKRRWLKKI